MIRDEDTIIYISLVSTTPIYLNAVSWYNSKIVVLEVSDASTALNGFMLYLLFLGFPSLVQNMYQEKFHPLPMFLLMYILIQILSNL